MRMFPRAVSAMLLFVAPVVTRAAQIEGDYLEARTADVYTGPCFSNSEVFITGHQAVLAWKVSQGAWNGVDLSGLAVAAAVRGSTTFSQDDPSRARAVLIVDERATSEQRDALIAMAKHLGGARLENVVALQTAPMSLSYETPSQTEVACHAEAPSCHANTPQAPYARFQAGELAEIAMRPLGEKDHHCGNEVIAYQPLSQSVDVVPAYTLGHSFQGDGLNNRWSDPNRRGSFIGHFSY